MGMYDYIGGIPEDSGYDNQVKLWENIGCVWEQGDVVLYLDSKHKNYSVRLNTTDENLPPRYVIVENRKITNVFSETPLPYEAVLDKWGNDVIGYQKPQSPIEKAIEKNFPQELLDALKLVAESFGRRQHRSERNFERELETVSGKWFQEFRNISNDRHVKYASLLCEFVTESLIYDRTNGFHLSGDENVRYLVNRLVEQMKQSKFEDLEKHIHHLRQIEDDYKRRLWTKNQEFISGLLIGDE